MKSSVRKNVPFPMKAAMEFNLGPVSQIPFGEGREFVVLEEKIAVFHLRGGHVYATQAECPHKKGPLADGLTGGNVVVCPYHAWKFDLRSGLPLLGDCSIQIYPVHVDKSGNIIVLI
jgi:nitrite reductase (NADH) small subunit